MCELDVFPIFLDNDLSKIATILGLTFLRQEKTSKDSKPDGFCFPIAAAEIFAQWIVHNSVYSRRIGRFVSSAFPNKKKFAQISKFIYDKQK